MICREILVWKPAPFLSFQICKPEEGQTAGSLMVALLGLGLGAGSFASNLFVKLLWVGADGSLQCRFGSFIKLSSYGGGPVPEKDLICFLPFARFLFACIRVPHLRHVCTVVLVISSAPINQGVLSLSSVYKSFFTKINLSPRLCTRTMLFIIEVPQPIKKIHFFSIWTLTQAYESAMPSSFLPRVGRWIVNASVKLTPR